MTLKANTVLMYSSDNVVTAIIDLNVGDIARFRQEDKWIEVEMKDNVLFGHKLSIEEIESGKPVMKYGETIGLTNRKIQAGEHVHVHNVDSVRGKGK